MSRIVNNTRMCIECSASVPRKVKRCPDCNRKFLENRGSTYARTPEHNALMSQATTGLKHYWKSASCSPEIAEKISKSWTLEMKEAARKRGLENSLDPDWRQKIAESVSGDKNPRWQDGHAQLPYSPGFGRKVKSLARELANHRCEICGSEKTSDTHHKDFEKKDHSLDNLQVLCRKCHKNLHAEHLRSRC